MELNSFIFLTNSSMSSVTYVDPSVDKCVTHSDKKYVKVTIYSVETI